MDKFDAIGTLHFTYPDADVESVPVIKTERGYELTDALYGLEIGTASDLAIMIQRALMSGETSGKGEIDGKPYTWTFVQ